MKKVRKVIFALFVALSLILGLSACTDKVKVNFDTESVEIKEGFSQKIPMELTGVKFDSKDLVAKSSDTSVFTVELIDGFAEVTAVAPGQATLKVAYKGKEVASVSVTITAREDLQRESLSIDINTELNIRVGDVEDVPITLTNILYNDPGLTVTSSDANVATATIKEGFITITGVAVGSATITLKKGDLVDTMLVNVSEAPVAEDETLVTFIVEVPMDTIGIVNVYGTTNDFVDLIEIPLTLNADGKYEGSKVLKVGSTFKYKYVNGNSWDYVEKAADGAELENRVITVTKDMASINDVVALWAGSTIPTQKVQVSFFVQVPEGTTQVYLVGTINGWNEADPIAMVLNPDTGRFEIELELDSGTTVQYKYLNGKDWANVEKAADGSEMGNREFTVGNTNHVREDIVSKWNRPEGVVPGENVTVKFVVTVPEGTPEVYIIGDLIASDWPIDQAVQLTKNADTGNYEVELLLASDLTYEYKYVWGKSWEKEELKLDGNAITNRTVAVTVGMEPVVDTVVRWKGIEPTTPPTEHAVTFQVTVPEETPADAEVYLIGSFITGWDLTNAVLLTKNIDTGNYEVTINLPAGEVAYKFVLNKTWENVEVQANGTDLPGDGNRKLVVEANLPVVEIAVARWKGVEPITPPADPVLVTIRVNVPAETVAPVVILHNFENNFDPDNGWSMTAVSEGVFELTYTFPAGTVFEYKYVLDFTWDHEELNADGTPLANNRSFTVATDMALPVEDTVVRWKGIEPPSPTEYEVTFVVAAPEGTTKVLLLGNFPHATENFYWDPVNGYEMVLNTVTNKYEYTLVLPANHALEYKYHNSENWEDRATNRTATVNAEITTDDTITAWQVPAPTEYEVKFVVAAPEGTTKVLLLGNFPHATENFYWDPLNGYEMVLNTVTNKYEYTLVLPANHALEYKFYNGENWEELVGNRTLTVNSEITTDDTITAWDVPETNMAKNPNFASGMDHWQTFTGAGAATYTPDADNGLKVDVTAVGASYEPRLSQMGIAFENGKSYRISFESKALALKTINLQIGEFISWDPWFINFINGWVVHREVGLEWSTLTFEFTMNQNNTNGGIIFEFGTVGESAVATTLWLRNVVVEEIPLLPIVNETVNFSVTVPEYTTGNVGLVSNLIGWDANNAIPLTKNDVTGKYEAEVQIQVGMTMEYKYVLNNNWANVEMQNDGITDVSNRVLNITAGMAVVEETVARWKGIEPPSAPENVDLTFSLTVPADFPADASVYMIGVFPGLEYVSPPTAPNHQWNNFTPEYKMVKGADGKYTLNITVPKNFELRYKYVYTVNDVDYIWEVNRESYDGNRIYKATITETLNEEVVSWQVPATITFSLTVPAETPASGEVYLIGVFPELEYVDPPTLPTHQWNNFTPEYKMVKGEGFNYSLTLQIPEGYTIKYNYVLVIGENKYWEQGGVRQRTIMGDLNISENSHSWGSLPPEEHMVQFSVTAPAGTTHVYLVGNVNEWNVTAAISLTYNAVSGKFEFNAPLSVGYTLEYKYLSGQHWAFEELDGLGAPITNRTLTVEETTTLQEDTILEWKNVYAENGAFVDVLFSVEVPVGTTGDVYLVGIISWDLVDAIKLTFNDVTGKYEGTVNVQSGKVYEYKFVNGTNWEIVDGNPTLNRVIVPKTDQTEQVDTVTAWQ